MSNNFYREKFQSSSGDTCALQEPLRDFGRIETYALFIIIVIVITIIIITIITIIIITVIIIIIIQNFMLRPTKQNEKRKKIALTAIWKQLN